ncbi:MAG: PHP domain-containing protein [Clostridiales bacterium]|jgi:predicted metal-dependent phosphoesterase TrpH|nr:PHP domain-containing protein [Clostridiales bacterium]
MYRLYYDFHIHTALSPCGDNDMTPNNVVNMSSICGLNCIAVTDHNSYLNIEACIKAAENNNLDLLVIPGMEVETQEELHVICLFPDMQSIKPFGDIVYSRLNKIPNNEKIFGPQQILNADDEEIGKATDLLITSTSIGVYELVELAKEHNGLAIPAHVDRGSYSIISNLGFIPPDLDISLIEFSRAAKPEELLPMIRKSTGKDFAYIISSDSHYLEHLPDASNFLEFEFKPSAYDVIGKLKGLGRK